MSDDGPFNALPELIAKTRSGMRAISIYLRLGCEAVTRTTHFFRAA